MNNIPESHGTVFRCGIRLGAGILAIAVLAFGSLTGAVESNKSAAFALQVTATEVFHPSTTVTPIPGLPPPPSGPAWLASRILRSLVLALVLFGSLFIAFTRPGAWNRRNMLEVCIGFLGWFLLNTFLWSWVMQNESGVIILNPTRIVPLLVNIVALIGLARVRRWVVVGIVCAILVNGIGLLLFPAPTTDIVHTDPMLERLIAMAPFYMPFFFPTL